MKNKALELLKSIDVNKFKAHPSSLYRLMGGYKSHLLTESEKDKLIYLKSKKTGEIKHKTSGKPLKITEKERKDLSLLIDKKENGKPKLSTGAKTVCEEWLGYQMFNDKLDINTKEIVKGKKTEKAGLLLASNVLNVFLSYNDNREDKHPYISYEIDAYYGNTILDIKSAYTSKSFPQFESIDDLLTKHKGYWWQGQGYMGAMNFKNYNLVYVLVNAPIEQILKAAHYEHAINTAADFEEVFKWYEYKMTYDDIPESLRIKQFKFEFDPDAFSYVENVVNMCRAYIQELINEKIKQL